MKQLKKELAGDDEEIRRGRQVRRRDKILFRPRKASRASKISKPNWRRRATCCSLPDLPKGSGGIGPAMGGALGDYAATSSARWINRSAPARVPGQRDLKSFLDQLDRQVSGELDRRALLDAQQYLQQMMKQGQGEKAKIMRAAAVRARRMRRPTALGRKNPRQSSGQGTRKEK